MAKQTNGFKLHVTITNTQGCVVDVFEDFFVTVPANTIKRAAALVRNHVDKTYKTTDVDKSMDMTGRMHA